jgi:hypothetical protein
VSSERRRRAIRNRRESEATRRDRRRGEAHRRYEWIANQERSKVNDDAEEIGSQIKERQKSLVDTRESVAKGIEEGFDEAERTGSEVEAEDRREPVVNE